MKGMAIAVATALGVAGFTMAVPLADAAAQLYEVSFVNTYVDPSSDLADGLGYITWDSVTKTMTSFSWDFREDPEPGQSANWLDPTVLDDAFSGGTGGTVGAALWEVLTGEDAVPDVTVVAMGFSDLYGFGTSNGFPDAAQFTSVGRFTFQRVTGPNSDDREIVADGTLTLRAVAEPATLALFGLGLAGIGAMRRRKLAA